MCKQGMHVCVACTLSVLHLRSLPWRNVLVSCCFVAAAVVVRTSTTITITTTFTARVAAALPIMSIILTQHFELIFMPNMTFHVLYAILYVANRLCRSLLTVATIAGSGARVCVCERVPLFYVPLGSQPQEY